MDILKRIDFVQQFANEHADGAWSIDTEKWRHHVTPELIEDIRQYIASLQLKLMHEQTAQAKPYTYLWEADGTCEAVKGHVSVSSNTGPAHGWKITPMFTRPAQPAEAQQVATHYDQQALELCPECGWKAIMPGEPCFVCNMKTEAQQVAVPMTILERARAMYAEFPTYRGTKPLPWGNVGNDVRREWLDKAKAQQVAVPALMTDIEVLRAARTVQSVFEHVPHRDVIEFVRAIEAHHGIGTKK